METKFVAATVCSISILIGLSSVREIHAASPLDDWSSPRPIKYSVSASVRRESASAKAIVDASPEKSELSNAGTAAQVSVLVTTQPPNNSGRGLFPVPELTIATQQPSTTAPRIAADTIGYQTPATPEPDQATSSSLNEQEVEVALDPQPPINAPSVTRVASAGKLKATKPAATVSVLSGTPSDTLPDHESKLPVPAIATKTVSGWQLGRLATQKTAHADELLRRRSPMAARQQALEALHLLAQSTNEVTRSSNGTEALSQALGAVREAADFLGRFGTVNAAVLQRLVDAHETRVLKRCDLSEVSPLRAADTYYEFARGRFVDAVGGWAPASQALVILAKTEPIAANESDNNLSAAQVCCLRAAIACDPENALAANELGHELLALGMFDEARWALEHSYKKKPSAASLQNLAELHRVTGNTQLAQACATNLAAIKQQQSKIAQVIQLRPEEFAKVSPQVMMPQTSVAVQPAVQYPNQAPQTQQVQRQPSVHQRVAHQTPTQQGRVASTASRAMDVIQGIFR